jgi:hypothetical protein
VGLDEVHSRFQIARLLDGMTTVDAFHRSAQAAEPLLGALQPLMIAERVQRAARSGCVLDRAAELTLRTAGPATQRACRR